MEGFLLAHTDHRARIRPERAAAQRNLIADSGSVDQPADHTHVGVCQRRIVEDRGVLLLSLDQFGGQIATIGTERLGRGVEIQTVPGFVLDLRHQDRLASQRRRTGEPVSLGLHSDDFGMRMLGDLADQSLAVAVRHPVARLDALVCRDRLVEQVLQVLWSFHVGHRTYLLLPNDRLVTSMHRGVPAHKRIFRRTRNQRPSKTGFCFDRKAVTAPR